MSEDTLFRAGPLPCDFCGERRPVRHDGGQRLICGECDVREDMTARFGALPFRLLSDVLAEDREVAAFRLLAKFHRETDCGRDGMHWAECDALVDSFGWESWESWLAVSS